MMNNKREDKLNDKWHDQVLDVSSIKFDQEQGLLRFSIIRDEKERVTPLFAFCKFGLFHAPLVREEIEIMNVAEVNTAYDEEECELYVVEVNFVPTIFRLTCTNGQITAKGDDLILHEGMGDSVNDIEVRFLVLPFIEFDWKRSLKK